MTSALKAAEAERQRRRPSRASTPSSWRPAGGLRRRRPVPGTCSTRRSSARPTPTRASAASTPRRARDARRGVRPDPRGRATRAVHDGGAGLPGAVALRHGDARPEGALRGRPRGRGGRGGPRVAERPARRSRSSTRCCRRSSTPRRPWSPAPRSSTTSPTPRASTTPRATSPRRSWPRWATSSAASPRPTRVFEATYRVALRPAVLDRAARRHLLARRGRPPRVRTSTQVPFHVRRIVAPLLGSRSAASA